MEIMTNDMSEIARKTKTETVSMKIITLVTLFFLPGTFIAVSCSSLYFLVSRITTLGVVAQLFVRSPISNNDG
jgi:DNA integrity scanning protein DisA with diadenylate cyclase activity